MHRNELPYPPPPAVLTAAERELAGVHRYPALQPAALGSALAGHFGVPPDWVVTGAGSVGVIGYALMVADAGELVLPWPSFEAYPAMAAAHRHTVRPTRLRPDGGCDLRDVWAAVTGATTVVVVCTPNPPTGGVVAHAELAELVARLPERVLVIVDEAYAEFVDDRHAARGPDLVRAYPNVVMTRTFSKAYGLAGLRVGYGLAQPALAAALNRVALPFAVSTIAETAAVEALRRPGRLRADIAAIRAERARLTAALRARGVPVTDSQANFVWAPLGARAERVAEHLARAGILVKAYPDQGVRITVGDGRDTDRLLAAWPEPPVAA
jgi:histidinol-phosphate aminotransferase